MSSTHHALPGSLPAYLHMTIDFDSYQASAMRTAAGVDNIRDLQLMGALGLGGEAGEVVDLIKKRFFHPHKIIGDDDIVDEMGDVLWYLAVLCEALDTNLSDVAEGNIQKLKARYPEGFPT